MVSFSPKAGCIEAGETTTVNIPWMSNDAQEARVVLKAVMIDKASLTKDFEQSWQAASEIDPPVKKIIEIYKSPESKLEDFQRYLTSSSSSVLSSSMSQSHMSFTTG